MRGLGRGAIWATAGGVRGEGSRPEKRLSFRRSGSEKRIAQLDEFPRAAVLGAYARKLRGQSWVVARRTPHRSAKRAPVKGDVFGARGTDGEVSFEMLRRHEGRSHHDIGQFRMDACQRQFCREARELGDGLPGRQLGGEDVAKDLQARKDCVFVGADVHPDRARKLAVDICGRDPGVGGVVVTRVIKFVAIGARQERPSWIVSAVT